MNQTILPNSIGLLIPDKDRGGRDIDATVVINMLMDYMASCFGGVQSQVVESAIKGDDETTKKEKTTLLESSIEEGKWPLVASVIMSFAILLTQQLNQRAVAAYINGELVVVDVDDSTDEPLHLPIVEEPVVPVLGGVIND